MTSSRKALAVLTAASVLLTLGAHAAIRGGGENQPGGSAQAALLDSLAIEFPNPGLAEDLREALSAANMTLDVFTHWNVSVDLYRRLPTLGYRLIILRVHTAAYYEDGRPVHVALGTGEPFASHRYVDLQLSRKIGALVLLTSDDRYFAVPPEFIRSEMEGNFHGAVVIIAGCKGLVTNVTAEALVRGGASVVIGWDEDVTATHTDAAVVLLVRLLAEGKTVEEAVTKVMEVLGPDPLYGARLRWYPQDAGGVRLISG